ncbi:hypothetical protein B9Z55_024687 [Caenorhabditis nigoni]|uniref:Uncharacterized protein n=1 Tax=Caenorhabditis nigoni TaxID=1611254 RepID=A0A2G5SV96_9PELO|nr:hypothetical protein B9Z55_024687 [Caenorhabditis nigoni]
MGCFVISIVISIRDQSRNLYAMDFRLRITSIYFFSLFNGNPKNEIHRGDKDEIITEFISASRHRKLLGPTPLNKIFPRKEQGTPFGLSSESIPVDARIPNHCKRRNEAPILCHSP